MAIFFLFTIFLAYVSLGLPDSVTGVAWPYVRAELNASLDYAGYMALIVTFCGMISSILSLKLSKKIGANKIVAFSCLMTGTAMLLYGTVNNYYLIIPLCFPLGLGSGAVDAVLNNYVSRNYSSRIMNWLHACWGIGAMISPVIMTSWIKAGHWRYGFFTIGAIQIGLSILFFSTLKLWHSDGVKKNETALPPPYAPDITLKHFAPYLSMLVFLFYVGIEGATGLWLNTLFYEFRGYGTVFSGISVSLYYGSIMVGRLLFGILKLSNKNAIRIGIGIAFVAAVGLIIKNQTLNIISVSLLGLGFAPVYPSMMHETSRRFNKETATKTIGLQMAAASLGALTFSPLIGTIGKATTMEILFYVVLCGIVIIWGLSETLNRMTKNNFR